MEVSGKRSFQSAKVTIFAEIEMFEVNIYSSCFQIQGVNDAIPLFPSCAGLGKDDL